MAKLLQILEKEKIQSRIKAKDSTVLNKNKENIEIVEKVMDLFGEINQLTYKSMSNTISLLSFREAYWNEHNKLNKSMIDIDTIYGKLTDNLSEISKLPQVKLSNLRKISEKLNMPILPIEYCELDKVFEINDNSDKLKKDFDIFKKIVFNNIPSISDKYTLYIMCPIDYYSVWEQIKTDVIKDIYIPESLDDVFTTIELMIPTQKNLYVASKVNDENLKEINSTFKANVKVLSEKIVKISKKVEKHEIELIKQKQEIENLKEENEELKIANIKRIEEIKLLYSLLDPIIFAIDKDIDIEEEETNVIIGMCFGADIDEHYLELKGIAVENKKLTDIKLIETLPKLGTFLYLNTAYKNNEIDNLADKIYKIFYNYHNNYHSTTGAKISLEDWCNSIFVKVYSNSKCDKVKIYYNNDLYITIDFVDLPKDLYYGEKRKLFDSKCNSKLIEIKNILRKLVDTELDNLNIK